MAIAEIADVWTFLDVLDVSTETQPGLDDDVEFTASDVAERMNRIALDEGLADDDSSYTNARKIGRVLDQLRISKTRKPVVKRTRLRSIRRRDALKLYRAYGLTDVSTDPETPIQQTSKTSTNVQTSNDNGDNVLSQRMCDLCNRALPTPEMRIRGTCDECAAWEERTRREREEGQAA